MLQLVSQNFENNNIQPNVSLLNVTNKEKNTPVSSARY